MSRVRGSKTDFTVAEIPEDLPAVKNLRSKADLIASFDSFMTVMNEMIVLLIVAGVILASVVLYNLGSMGSNVISKWRL